MYQVNRRLAADRRRLGELIESYRRQHSPPINRFFAAERQRRQEVNAWLAAESRRLRRLMDDFRRREPPWLTAMLAAEIERLKTALSAIAIRN